MKLNDNDMYGFFDNLANDHDFKSLFNNFIEETESDTLLFDISAVIDVAKCYENLQLIYPERDVHEQILLVDNLQKIFRKVFQINGLERLLATSYSDIEWSMFLEFDFTKGQSKYYRDHFVHQFRDAYLAFKLLKDCNIHSGVRKVFEDGTTIVSKYVNNMINRQEKFDVLQKKGDVLHENGDVLQEIVEKREKYYGEIIFKTVLLSAIFHDIGYPLSYYSRISSQIQNSLPFYKVVCSTGKTDFLNIKTLLADSLLFRTVDNNEIKCKYENNDHGVMSAICFLLNFYYTGGISDLSSINRCVIEMSARTIYDHTNEYKYDNRMTFYENPISYLLRISDDLQEWSRFAFSVNENNNSMICEDSLETISTTNGICYSTISQNNKFIKTTNMKSKKINYVSACDEVELTNSNDSKIEIKLNYDPFQLIEISSINFTYAAYREKELLQLEKMFPNQKYLPEMNLSYNLSNNVFYLAQQIIDRFNEIKDTDVKTITRMIKEDSCLDEVVKECYCNIFDKIEKMEHLDILEKINKELEKSNVNAQILYLSDMKEFFCNLPNKQKYKWLSTNEYSLHHGKSKEFLKKYIGFLGVLNLMCKKCFDVS